MRDISRPNAPKWDIFFKESGVAGVQELQNEEALNLIFESIFSPVNRP